MGTPVYASQNLQKYSKALMYDKGRLDLFLSLPAAKNSKKKEKKKWKINRAGT